MAADLKTMWSLRSHSGAAFFTNINTMRTLFQFFFVYLVASINKLELEPPEALGLSALGLSPQAFENFVFFCKK